MGSAMSAITRKNPELIKNNGVTPTAGVEQKIGVTSSPAGVTSSPAGVTSSPAGVTSSPKGQETHNFQNGKPQIGGSRKKKIKFKRMKNKTNKKHKKSKSKSPKYLNIQNNQ
jgi:hypothetical protein